MVLRVSIGEFAVRALIFLALAALAALLWRVGDIFILIFGGVVLARVLRSAMHLVVRFTPLRGRWALLVGILGLLVLLGLIGLLIGSRVTTQMGQLTQTLPQAWERAREQLGHSSTGRGMLQALQGQATAGRWLARMSDLATVTLGALVQIGVILFTGLYFAIDPQLYRRGLLRLMPEAARPRAQQGLDAAGAALGHWLKGVLLAMLSIGVITGVGLWALGVPLALALGILGGLLEFVPYVGPIIAAVPAVLIAFAIGPTRALEVIALYLVVHLIEGELLVPLIQRWAVSLPPAVGIVAVVVFGWLFGMSGVIFATPMAVVIMTLVERLYVRALETAQQPQSHRVPHSTSQG